MLKLIPSVSFYLMSLIPGKYYNLDANLWHLSTIFAIAYDYQIAGETNKFSTIIEY